MLVVSLLSNWLQQLPPVVAFWLRETIKMVLVLPLKTVVISVSFHNCVKRPAMIIALVVPLNQFTTTMCVSLLRFLLLYFQSSISSVNSFEVSLSERFAEFRRDEFNSSGKRRRRRRLLPRSIMGFATYMVHWQSRLYDLLSPDRPGLCSLWLTFAVSTFTIVSS